MENKDQPAFTMLDPNGGYTAYGLTKREYFAGIAMQGLLATRKYSEGIAYNPALTSISLEISDDLLKQLDTKPALQ